MYIVDNTDIDDMLTLARAKWILSNISEDEDSRLFSCEEDNERYNYCRDSSISTNWHSN